jgi:26S proteasome regulatory subunit N7
MEFDDKLKQIEVKIEDAKKNLGDMEIRDAEFEKAMLYKNANKSTEALQLFDKLLKEHPNASVGKKMDVVLEILKIGEEEKNIDLMLKYINKFKDLFKEGGDWERKNRCIVYEGVYHILIRDFHKASELLVSVIPNYTGMDIFDFKGLVFYSVITSLLTQPRPFIKKNIIHSPDVLTIIKEIPYLKEFSDSFYYCKYDVFFKTFVELSQTIKNDKYLSKHWKYYMREMTIRAYSQYLESYKSVQIKTMADAFGISAKYLDKELSRLISSGRLSSKIDMIAGIIESNRPDEKISQYQKLIRHGDLLINRLQKLTKVLEI